MSAISLWISASMIALIPMDLTIASAEKDMA